MDVPGAHPPAVERDNFFFDSGDVPLVFGDELRLEFTVPVPGHIDPEPAVLALEVLWGVAIALI